MEKFEIKDRWSGQVKFTAEIECDESASYSVKLGLAVQWALKVGANLTSADLTGADLIGANLACANLTGAYLTGADLAGANLIGTDLTSANLTSADLTGANLTSTYLTSADLIGANLTGVNLIYSCLTGADLTRANLTGANLTRADLVGASGLNDWIKCIQIESWPIVYTSEVMQIGCQRHSLEAWREFSDAEIRAMNGMKALNFWRKWKDWIFQTIEMAPAKPTKENIQ